MPRICWFATLLLLLAAPAAAQTLDSDLAKFVETPAVTGYEAALAKEITARIEKFKPQSDNMGNVWVTLGTGAPHRLIVAPMDEPGYVVSAVTDDGFLRVQRLPQTLAALHPQFDQLHAAQAVVIATRRGKRVYGVVAGLSTHLQTARRDAPRVNHPDEIYIDIGANSAAQARAAGVDVLDPVAIDRQLYSLGYGKLAGAAVGDRFGAAALVELLRRLDTAKVQGTLTIAFVAQQWATSRGFDRLTQHIKADEVIYVGRLRRTAQGGGAAAATEETQPAQRRAPKLPPGSGVLIGLQDPEAAPTGLPAALWKIAQENKIQVATDFTAALPRVSYTRGPELPQRFAHIAIATAWPSTPAEIIDISDWRNLVLLLEFYAQGMSRPPGPSGIAGSRMGSFPSRPQTAPATTDILRNLVEVYGVSGFEGPVRKEIERLLPPWAKPETDDAGNLILRFGSTGAGKEPRIVFVAHTDEIGYVIRSIGDDGRLAVQSRGGGIIEFFAGHPVLVHVSTGGTRPGVMELPAGWDQPNFEWPRGQAAAGILRVDVGARTPAEVENLGIRVGDSITVPKKYRKLYGTRANGRSFDDRVGCTALVAAAWTLGPSVAGHEIIFLWATEEEVGLRGANAAAQKMAADGRAPDYVFAVDTFVSSDSPLESKRFANAPIGKGFVVRAVDNSNIVRRELVDKLVALARAQQIPVQYGVTGGGNDGAVFLRHGTIDIPISWPLRYSHSPGEVIDTRDVDALARIVAAIARNW